jgi:putative DNA primase/helicase
MSLADELAITTNVHDELTMRMNAFDAVAADNKPEQNQVKSWAKKAKERTQGGLTEKLIQKHEADFKYIKGIGWLAWTGTHWADGENTLLKAAQGVVDDYLDEGEHLIKQAYLIKSQSFQDQGSTPDLARKLEKEANEIKALCKGHRTAKGLKGIETMAQMNLTAKIEDFDRNIWLLNCANGTLNLRTGQLKRHERDDLITKLIPIEYDKDAQCPRWNQFLKEIMCDDLDLIDYLQRIIGLCLTGSNTEQSFFVLHGSGRNGKTVFMTTIQALLGCYTVELKSEILLKSGGPTNAHGPTEELAKLVGTRLVTANETEQGRKLSESLVKQMTGGDKITARKLHQSPIEFIPQFKLFLRTNHKPDTEGDDNGLWRRIKLIPFEKEFTEFEADLGLAETIQSELPGILSWALEGLHKYLEPGSGGLKVPQKVLEATQEYRNEQNEFSSFLRHELVPKMRPSEKGYTTRSIQERFNAWAQRCHLPIMLEKDVTKELKKLGWGKERGTGKNGPRLNTPPPQWRTLTVDLEALTATQDEV